VAKEDFLIFEGIVEDVLPNTMFKVRVNENYVVMTTISGKMRQNKIRISRGDQVKVEVGIYDLHKGRITYRTK
jgi:translation initiation factor IF-1